MSELAILCVEDEVVILDSLKEQLKRNFGNQYIYEVAESVEKTWKIIAQKQEEEIKFILIVFDWLMSRTKGDEFLIQVHQKLPQLIKVILTVQANEATIQNNQAKPNRYPCLDTAWTEQQVFQTITSALT